MQVNNVNALINRLYARGWRCAEATMSTYTYTKASGRNVYVVDIYCYARRIVFTRYTRQ